MKAPQVYICEGLLHEPSYIPKLERSEEGERYLKEENYVLI